MNYIQQAYKGKKEWYHWMLTLFVVFVGWQLVGIIPLFVVASMHSASMSEFVNSGKDNFMTLGIDNNLFLFLMNQLFDELLLVDLVFSNIRVLTTLLLHYEN